MATSLYIKGSLSTCFLTSHSLCSSISVAHVILTFSIDTMTDYKFEGWLGKSPEAVEGKMNGVPLNPRSGQKTTLISKSPTAVFAVPTCTR
jgi:hypothetical protein